ncbi:DUF7146 domain-containing protein [Neisseria lisongii]|uniref:Toprim domain-containing protein n=1 Tax=Neisseria lisongii TaxID=2912188 RepID=A0AAW5AP85_9NEIS|nr:toprim domain-containing protein [Neisseria lisongii]MCF7530319.1 toprim domain-containing protein [Neisseria lisongii]
MRTDKQKPSYGRLDDLKAAARGRWPQILTALGIPEHYTDPRKHQPCPACGGKDRFRFTDYKQGGGFICNHCTPDGGSGFDLIMLLTGYSFTEAAQAVAGVLGMGGSVAAVDLKAPPQTETAAADSPEKRQRLAKLWQECKPWQETRHIADYLHKRGIPYPEMLPIHSDLRLHPNLGYWHSGRIIGHFPAMVAVYRDAEGKPCGLHQTYLSVSNQGETDKVRLFDPKTHQRLPAKKMQTVAAGSLTGAAMRLFKPENGVLGVCEGIETAVAARYISGVAMWACGSAHGMKTLVLPDGIRELVIIADNDPNRTGIEAAKALQRRYHGKLDSIKIWQPDCVGADALDVLAANVQKGV